MKIILLIFLHLFCSDEFQHPLFNQKIPHITGFTLNNRKIDDDYFQGKVTFINFWAVGCQPCMKEIPFLNQLHDEYKGQDFQILGIAPHSRSHLFDFLSEKTTHYSAFRKDSKINKINFELLPEGEISRKSGTGTKKHVSIIHDCDSISQLFKVKAYPTNFLVDRNGFIRMVRLGYTIEKDDSELQQFYRQEIEKLLEE